MTTSPNPDTLIQIATLKKPYGIKGWLWVFSLTDNRSDIFDMPHWYMKTALGFRPLTVSDWREQGQGWWQVLRKCLTVTWQRPWMAWAFGWINQTYPLWMTMSIIGRTWWDWQSSMKKAIIWASSKRCLKRPPMPSSRSSRPPRAWMAKIDSSVA